MSTNRSMSSRSQPVSAARISSWRPATVRARISRPRSVSRRGWPSRVGPASAWTQPASMQTAQLTGDGGPIHAERIRDVGGSAARVAVDEAEHRMLRQGQHVVVGALPRCEMANQVHELVVDLGYTGRCGLRRNLPFVLHDATVSPVPLDTPIASTRGAAHSTRRPDRAPCRRRRRRAAPSPAPGPGRGRRDARRQSHRCRSGRRRDASDAGSAPRADPSGDDAPAPVGGRHARAPGDGPGVDPADDEPADMPPSAAARAVRNHRGSQPAPAAPPTADSPEPPVRPARVGYR